MWNKIARLLDVARARSDNSGYRSYQVLDGSKYSYTYTHTHIYLSGINPTSVELDEFQQTWDRGISCQCQSVIFRNSSVLLCTTSPITNSKCRWWIQYMECVLLFFCFFFKYNHLPHDLSSNKECTRTVRTSPLIYTRLDLQVVTKTFFVSDASTVISLHDADNVQYLTPLLFLSHTPPEQIHMNIIAYNSRVAFMIQSVFAVLKLMSGAKISRASGLPCNLFGLTIDTYMDDTNLINQ
jgi:hypothetical protein